MEIDELYQELILEHSKHPKNRGALPDVSHQAEGYNPLCGDRVKVYLKLKDNKVEDIRFEGEGCAISKASASMMTESLKGKSLEEARALGEKFRAILTGGEPAGTKEQQPSLDDLQPLFGIKNFPTRVKCATLAWHAFESAVKDPGSVGEK